MYVIVLSSRAKRSLKKYRKNGVLPVRKYDKAIEHLRQERPLPMALNDHALRGELVGHREFHLAYDLLVQYRRNEGLHTITIVRVGTHNELFGR